MVQVTEFRGRHFQRWKISQGRRHKSYLDKSEIGSTRNPERSSHTYFLKMPKVIYIENDFNTYSIAEVQLKGHQIDLIKITMKNRKKIFDMGLT